MANRRQPAKKEFVDTNSDIAGYLKMKSAVGLSGEQYRILVETAGAGIAAVDTKGNYTYVNDKFCLLIGCSRDDLLFNPFGSHVHKDDLPYVMEVFLAGLKGVRHAGLLEFRLVTGGGQCVWVHCNPEPLVLDGRITGFSVIIYDISDRKQLEEALLMSEEKYRSMLDQMQDAYYETDLDGNFTFVTDSTAQRIGYSREEMIGRSYRDFVPDEEVERIYNACDAVYKKGKPHKGFAHGFRRKDGSISFAEMSIDLSRDKSGNIVGFKFVSRDINERRQMEDELQRLAMVVHHSCELVNLAALDGKMVFLNGAAAAALGVDPCEAVQFNIMQIIPAHLKQKVQFEILPLLVRGGTWEGDLQYLNIRTGQLIDVHTIAFAIKDPSAGAPLYIANISLDISERRKAELALSESEKWFRAIVEHVTDIFYILNGEGKLRYVSPQAEKILGYTTDEMLNGWQNFLSDNPLNTASEGLTRRAIETGEKQVSSLLEFVCKDGERRLAEFNESPLKNDQGEVIGIVGAAHDITERKRIEMALRESEEKYRMVVENAQESIFINVNGKLVFANNMAETVGGYSQEELASRPFIEFIHPDDRSLLAERHVKRLKGEPLPDKFTLRVLLKPGDVKWVELTAVPITWEGSPAILNFMVDITDRKRLEEERQRVAKLESVGLLAGGIAHDFNNILTAILGNISLARMDTELGSGVHDSLEQAERASLRAKDLTGQLLTFSKGGAPVRRLASLDHLIIDTTGFALRGSNVKCLFSISAELWHAEIDTGQISQVVSNLVINAQHAMPAGGTMQIKAENMILTKQQSLGSGLPLKEGNYIRIAVTDHGSGIAAEYLDRIFEPFFTTKQKGSGLGLATSFSIARNHGGHLSVESVLGSGTTFYLYLPASMEKHTPKPDKKEGLKYSGKARILVMDDEEEVRKVADRLLKRIGYGDIEYAVEGNGAVDLYKTAMESGQPFDVVILDLTIPGGMGGEMTLKKLLEIDPAVTAVVSSGYADGSVMADYRTYGFKGMIAKPYTIEELRKSMQEVIG